ncbi:iron-sulfur protein [Methanocella sp. CWC-04]|uniref:Iron-sulfur protein n=1 Tax=Methanooceanicella nereidis TaxID=2052831 RepID=A0AAP2RDF2_9EURY|nr:flavodoxin family protein [Methanocella sp. CWC-04]MCD1295268.1 iron-sulfur protein [Methanocella sp. CWC-04]
MKVIGIQGSPRGRNSFTLKLLESALEGAESAGAETEIIDITKRKINFCTGCCHCYKTGECPQKDDFDKVYEKILDADGIIMASPVYFNSVTAQLKAFMDRTGDCRHCLLLEGKYGMSVVTTASSGGDSTAEFMNDFMNMSGAFTIGCVSVAMPQIPGNMEEACKKSRDMGVDLIDAIKTGRQFPEQKARQKAFIDVFKYAVMNFKEEWASEYEYFVKKGWIKA